MRRIVTVTCVLVVGIGAATVAVSPESSAGGTQAACVPNSGPVAGAAGPVLATPDAFAGHAEPALAVSPRRPDNLLGAAQFAQQRTFTRVPGTFFSMDGGRNWHDNGPLPLPPGYDHGDDVTAAFAGGTALVAAEIAKPNGDGGVFVWRSTNGGRRFSDPVAVSNIPAGTDHPSLTVPDEPAGRRAVVVAWSQGEFLMTSRSVDGGRIFTAPQVVSAPSDQYPDLAVVFAGRAQQVSVIYAAASATGPKEANGAVIRIATSEDAGATFGSPVTVPGALATQGTQPYQVSLLSAATDPRTGNRYVTFAEQFGQAARLRVFITHDAAGDGHWTVPAPVDAASGVDQFQPSVASVGGGRVVVTYFAVVGGRVAEFGTQLGGRARTWRLGAAFDPNCGLTAGVKEVPWLGDYQALASADGRSYAAWTDGGTGYLQILVKRIACGQTTLTASGSPLSPSQQGICEDLVGRMQDHG